MMPKSAAKFVISFAAVIAIFWIINLGKLFHCDFESNWRCEAIHAAGVVVPYAAIVTVWFETDGE